MHVRAAGHTGVHVDAAGDVDRDDGNAGSLGLQLVNDLTQQLHGSIAVKRGSGTNFTVTFAADGRSEM